MALLATIVLSAQLGAALPADSLDRLRDDARSAEARFERLSRRLAPVTWLTFSASSCDEIVGRFCLRFDSTSAAPPARAEDGSITRARREAVEAGRRWFSAAPGDREAAGPLVRLLILDGRPAEAVAAARAFGALSPDSLWTELLTGLALHAAGHDSAAERRFARALARLDEDTRREWLDPSWLLDHSEQGWFRQLAASSAAEYQRRFWILADPFWLTPANERWVEHVARHVQSRLLAEVPRVAGMLRWADDLEQLTVRYGTPVARSRLERTGMLAQDGMVEYWDSASRAYTPARLSDGVPEPPLPGERPPLYSARARSSYAFGPVPRVLELPHQVTRFLVGDSVRLRVDGVVRADSAAGGESPLALIAFDTAFSRRFESRGRVRWADDSARFTLHLTVPPGRAVYSIEVLDPAAHVAARARYALDGLVPDEGPIVSDLLVTEPFADGPLPSSADDERVRARPTLAVQPGDTIGIYAEAYRLPSGMVAVEVGLERVDEPSLLGRFARWIGRAAGLVEPETEPRVAWTAIRDDVVHTIVFNLPLDPGIRGRYELVLRVTDTAGAGVAESRRGLLIDY